VVVPTNRPEQFDAFVEAWMPLFLEHEVHLFPVIDNEETWERMPDWMPRRTDMIRSLGFYEAWLKGSEFTLTLDDDVRPAGDVDIFEKYEEAFDRPTYCSEYFNVGDLTTDGYAMRGFPFRDRAPAIPAVQYGGWHGVLDYDAASQLVHRPHSSHEFAPVCIPVPKGVPVTTCIMNAAFRTEFTPLMWQLPMHDGKYNRFGDIWSGLLQKKILDAFGWAMLINGTASVYHERASDPIANLEREAPGIRINETVWEHLGLWDWKPECGDTIGDAYGGLVRHFATHPDLDGAYSSHLTHSVECWLRWFEWA
jgi:hypothetical protein